MKRSVEWNDHFEVFELVSEALGNSDSATRVWATEEQGTYGEDGYIDITMNGKRYRLDLTIIE